MKEYGLYKIKDAYDHHKSDDIFIKVVRRHVSYHNNNCKTYANILKSKNFNIKKLKSIRNLEDLPPIPTLYLKHHRLSSIPNKRMIITATSSGTKGRRSSIGFNLKGLLYGAHMVYRIASHHKLLSLRPTNYIILGYEPNKHNKTVISKTAYGSSFFAPGIHREFALRYKNGDYHLDLDNLILKIKQYSKYPFPVRLIGFPSYMFFYLQELNKRNIKLKLPKGSKVYARWRLEAILYG